MNQTQIKYMTTRAGEIRTSKIEEINRKYTTSAVTLNNLEKLEALKAGKFTVSDKADRITSTWYYAIKFNDERPLSVNSDKIKAEVDKIQEAYTKLMDELILGDSETAMRLLKTLEAL